MFNTQRVKSWLLKKHLPFIETVEEDSEVVEVVLRPEFINAKHQETIWVFGKDRYESGDYTLSAIKDDLRSWMDGVSTRDSE